jgi:hypothetical protein
MSDNAAGKARHLDSKAGQTLILQKRLIVGAIAASLGLMPVAAEASIFGKALSYLGLADKEQAPETMPAPAAASPEAAPAAAPAESPLFSHPRSFSAYRAELSQLELPSLPSVAIPSLPAPSVEIPLKKLFCVEYARARSGLALFGDAKLWWTRAKNVYARLARPAEEAVMVFSGSKRLAKGHVAVVTDIISSREIRVDQANWQNHGEIDHSTPVLDVSKKNDWSQVRVWDVPSGSFGAHVYAISGFIAKNPVRQAAND